MSKTYIVAPNYTTRPPSPDDVTSHGESFSSNALFLGDIIRHPLGPELDPLNRADRIPIPAADLVLPVDVKRNFTATRQTLLSGRFGIWATLLATMGLPVDVAIGLFLERNSEDVISASALETHEFIATDEFVNKSMGLDSIVNYLEGCRDPPPPLYMITGLKIVRGPSAKSGVTTKAGASLGANFASGDVMKILEFTRSKTEGLSFDKSTPFILAYRLRKILYKRGKYEHGLFQKGASMMDGSLVTTGSEVEVNGLGEEMTSEDTIFADLEIHVQKDGKEEDWIIAKDEW
ncbi:Fc.00g084670.m01.CDS01 [Cosmosporella sp. VM-42]